MDHTMKKRFAKELVNHSSRFEPFAPTARPNGIDALSMMNGLENLARESVQKEAHEQRMEKEKTQPKPLPQKTNVTYATRNPQYKAALKDEALIQALLDLQNKSASKKFPSRS